MQTVDEDLREAFGKYGPLAHVKIVMDQAYNRPRGYGFVTFEKQDDANAAKDGMDGSEFMGRTIKVDLPTQR